MALAVPQKPSLFNRALTPVSEHVAENKDGTG
jgi:hypothetical protein